MSATGPHRQRSLRDRIHQGISSLTWQAKPSNKSASSFTTYTHSSQDASKPYIVETSDNRSLSLDTHGYVNPLDWDVSPLKSSELKLDVNPILAAHQPILSGLGEQKVKSPDSGKPEPEKKMVAKIVSQPEGTMLVTVSASDTLAGIAARFYTTPSELTKINKLSSRLIFPGQTLYVPDKEEESTTDGSCATPPSTPVEKQACLPLSPTNQGNSSLDLPTISKPGHVERVVSPDTKTGEKSQVSSPTLSQEEERKLDDECHKKFLKINVRHITDGQGVVPGVLLITPNALMFDPNVSDPLVIEHGPEKYSVTCPMNMVANAAMYRDIAHMRLKNVQPCSEENMRASKVYHSKDCPKFSEDDAAKSESGQQIQFENADFKEDDCTCPKSVPETNPEVPPEPPTDEKDYKSCEDPEVVTASSDLMDLSTNLVYDDEDIETQTEIEQPKNNLKLLNPIKITEDKSSEEPQKSPVLAATNAPVSSKEGTPEKLTKNAWYSQLSEISNLPSQIDFSMFKSNKPENSECLLSTSLSESTEQQSAAESHKTRLFKRFSQPVSWIESFASGSVDSAAEITASAQFTLSRIIPHAFSSSSDKEETPPSSAGLNLSSSQTSSSARHFSTSPQSFVDFSSGLFAEDSTHKVKDVSELSIIGQSKFYRPPEEGDMIRVGKSSFLESTDSVESALSANKFSVESNSLNSKFINSKNVQIQNMVDENPNLFASIDKLIPKPAATYEDPPLYLCLLMGHPLKPSQDNMPPLHRHALMSYGQRCIKAEYWFSIPKEKVDELYGFFNLWSPGVYGDPSTINFEAKGYRLIESDEEFEDDEIDGGSKVSMTTKSRPQSSPRSVGSLLKMVEEHFLAQSPFERESDSQVLSLRDVPSLMSIDGELPLPEMMSKSEILNDQHRRSITNELPARSEGYPWQLLYSNSEHGFSLKTLYREMTKYECPAIVVILDTNNAIFGAMFPCSLRISDHFYGNGESFLFTFHPDFKCFNWTGENNYFIKGAPDSLAFGAGEGVFGLWLDEDLYKGRSHKCLTYNNDRLSSTEDFVIAGIEVWGFM